LQDDHSSLIIVGGLELNQVGQKWKNKTVVVVVVASLQAKNFTTVKMPKIPQRLASVTYVMFHSFTSTIMKIFKTVLNFENFLKDL